MNTNRKSNNFTIIAFPRGYETAATGILSTANRGLFLIPETPPLI